MCRQPLPGPRTRHQPARSTSTSRSPTPGRAASAAASPRCGLARFPRPVRRGRDRAERTRVQGAPGVTDRGAGARRQQAVDYRPAGKHPDTAAGRRRRRKAGYLAQRTDRAHHRRGPAGRPRLTGHNGAGRRRTARCSPPWSSIWRNGRPTPRTCHARGTEQAGVSGNRHSRSPSTPPYCPSSAARSSLSVQDHVHGTARGEPLGPDGGSIP